MPTTLHAKTILTALSLLSMVALAACSSPPPPPPAPPPAPPPPAAPPPPPGPPTASSDQEFINLAAGANASEIGMGRLAQGKAASRAVKAFGARMVSDHGKAERQLESLAKRLKIAPSPPPDQPPPDLLTASGPDFDRQYIGMMIKAHQDAIALFESEANGGQDPRVKRFARSTLPTLHRHLREAESIGRKTGL
jgi:putative membrane protein